MSSDPDVLMLSSSHSNKSLVDEKLRSLIRASEIALTRIPAATTSSRTAGPNISCPSRSPARSQPTPVPSLTAGLVAASNATGLSSSANTITISITSSSAAAAAPCSSQPASIAVNGNHIHAPGRSSDDPPSVNRIANITTDQPLAKKKKKKKRKDSLHVVQRVIYAPSSGPRCRSLGHLFRHRLDQESGDEEECFEPAGAADAILPLHDQVNLPLPAATFFTRNSDIDQDLGAFRAKLISQKWFLSKWVGLKKQQLQQSATQIRHELEQEERMLFCKRSAIQRLLDDDFKRMECHTSAKAIRKGSCCFASDEFVCPKPSLPFTRHCKQHILYNVDQLLFTRCTAKSSSSSTQCSNATFDIEHDEPICEFHMRCGNDLDDVRESGGKSVRKRTKQMALTRPARRKKRKGKGTDSGNDVASEGPGDYVNDAEETVKLPPPYPSSCPVASDSASSGIPAALDVGIPNLNPNDEALVASLVEDLPPLGAASDHTSGTFDAELTEVLNKMPVDAFNELFADHSLKGSVLEADAAMEQPYNSKGCHSIPNNDTTYAYLSHTHQPHPPVTNQIAGVHVNGHIAPQSVHSSPRPLLNSAPLPNDDLVNNILGFLTTEQQQQLNGLIDGALASGSLSPSPTDATDVSSMMSANFKPANQMPGAHHPAEVAMNSGHPLAAAVAAPFAQFNSRLNPPPRIPPLHAPASFTSPPGSLIITGLNEASVGRSNQFVRLSDMRLSQEQAVPSPGAHHHPPVKNNCIPRPVSHHPPVARPLPSLAAATLATFDKKSS